MEWPLYRTCRVASLKRLPLAGFAGDEDVGQKVHLHLDEAVAAAGLAAPALDVEGEAPLFVAPGPGFGQEGEKIPDEVEDLGVGGRVAPRGAADGLLVDVDDLVQVLQALDGLVWLPPPGSDWCEALARAG